MPELPEVETVMRGLAPHLPGKRIVRVRVLWPKTAGAPGRRDRPESFPGGFGRALRGRRVERLFRRGKYICLDLDNRSVLTLHLGMTGRLLFDIQHGQRKHLRLEIVLDDDTRLFFVDPRKFGRARIWPPGVGLLQALGVEPLEEKDVEEALRGCRSRRAVKTVLLDQSVLAGVGNIYADESLFQARIHPLTPAASLVPARRRRLAAAVVRVLTCAIADLGTTLRDYRTADGEPGTHQECLRVYGRTGEPCLACGAAIRREVVGGRSSHFCPRCQRPMRGHGRKRPRSG